MFRCGGKNFRAGGAAGGGWVDMGVVVTEYLTTPDFDLAIPLWM